MRIVAEAEIEEIIESDILTVWKLTKEYAGVSYNFYRKYYKGKKKAIAYKKGAVAPVDYLSTFATAHLLQVRPFWELHPE